MWQRLGNPYSVHTQQWPKYDEALAKADEVEIAVQVNGKVRDRITVAAGADDETIKAAALASDKIKEYLNGGKAKKVIVIKGRLVNIVI